VLEKSIGQNGYWHLCRAL